MFWVSIPTLLFHSDSSGVASYKQLSAMHAVATRHALSVTGLNLIPPRVLGYCPLSFFFLFTSHALVPPLEASGVHSVSFELESKFSD